MFSVSTGSYRVACADAHHEMARRIQVRSVYYLRQSVRATGREQRGDKRLERSLLDDRNRIVSSRNFHVGIEDWLDQSPARLYWRALEIGGDPYTTRGFFISKAGKRTLPSGVGFRETYLRDPSIRLARPVKFGRDLQMIQSTSTRYPEIRVSGTPEYAYMEDAFDWFTYDYSSNAKYLTYQRAFRRAGVFFTQRRFVD